MLTTRIAVSDPANTVSLVWNDTRFHPLGDVLLQRAVLVAASARVISWLAWPKSKLVAIRVSGCHLVLVIAGHRPLRRPGRQLLR